MNIKYWEIIADEIHAAGWSYGYIRVFDSKNGWTWIVDAHREDGHRYVVQAETLMTAFIVLQQMLNSLNSKMKSQD